MSNSEKLKALLESKELQCNSKIKKLKRNMKIIKCISVTISISTIIILAIMASTVVLSPIVISILSIISGTLIGIDFKFKFDNRTFEKIQLINKLNEIQTKLEYVNSSNGNLTEQEYNNIFKEFNTVL